MDEDPARAANDARQRRQALSQWENEGGAGSASSVRPLVPADATPPLSPTELVQMRIRIIALENLVIALLADAPQRQLDRVRDMAAYISPRPGFTPHPLTLHAAAEMVGLVERAGHFRTGPARS